MIILYLTNLFLLFADGIETVGGAKSDMNIVLSPAVNMVHQQVDQTGIVLAGFQDCTDEAIRYLVTVERFPEQDPLIEGLKRHLWERQQDLDVETLLQNQLNTKSVLNQLNSTGLAGHHQSMVGTVTNNNSQVSHQEVNENLPVELLQSDSVLLETSQQGEDEDVSQNVFELAMLAHNNPAIACLTEQIISLLDEEEDEDEDDKDSVYDLDIDLEESLDTSGSCANTSSDSQSSAIDMESEESYCE